MSGDIDGCVSRTDTEIPPLFGTDFHSCHRSFQFARRTGRGERPAGVGSAYTQPPAIEPQSANKTSDTEIACAPMTCETVAARRDEYGSVDSRRTWQERRTELT
jgi:hypothetical protein